MDQPKLEFAFEIRAEVSSGKIEEVKIAKGLRRIIPISGGNFEGPAIRGSILPGGNDWQLIRSDGVTELEARYLLRTDDGICITIVNSGLRHGPPEVMQKLAAGEEVSPDQYYFRSIPVFETGDSRYEWLTKNIFIANGIRQPNEVFIQVWKVL